MNILPVPVPTPSRPRLQLPGLSDRITIIGRTGTGKTVAGAWLLSQARFDLQPFIVMDFKGEKLFSHIRRIQPLDISDPLPSSPGLYHLRPYRADFDRLEDWLWRVWENGKIGLFIDEGYLLPDKHAWRALLVTGRSRDIPVYTLSQRPVKLPRFTVSEADFYMMFNLNDRRDRKTIGECLPDFGDEIDFDERLPRFHSRWYDVAADKLLTLGPVPDMSIILETFERRLTPRQTLL